jgi:hypothetical protein
MRRLSLPSATFRAFAHDLTDFATDYLEKLPQLPSYPPNVSGYQTERLFGGDIPLEGIGAAAFDSLPEILAYSRPASPRFFGYVFGSGEPVGILGEFAANVLHQNATAWRSAPAAVAIERTVIRWLANAVGCSGFSGSLTSGGSAANLMGLCLAREARAPANHKGAHAGAIYCSTEAHMSILKAAALLGLGYEAVTRVDVNEAFQLRTESLRREIRQDLQNGKVPIAVVASAGTTATGSVDPLARLRTCAMNLAFGCMSTVRTARSLPWLYRLRFVDWSAPIRYHLIRTNGFTSLPGADVCFIEIQLQQGVPSHTLENMQRHSLMIQSKGFPFSRSQSSFQDLSGRSIFGCRCDITGFTRFRNQFERTYGSLRY